MSFFGNASGNNNKIKNREKYRELTLAIKQIVLERSKNRCHDCSKKLSGSTQPQFYYVNGSKKDNRPENLRALCSECYEDRLPKNKNDMFSSIKKLLSKK